jgi:glycosidase
VGSFSDSDGDGTGDLRGIINRMDYLNDGDPASGKSLGIEGIWLTPIFESPSYHKYDVTDYYRIDPAFGTTEDLQELIRLCHERGVKLILDLPLNHTGDRNAWFTEFISAHAKQDPASEYYDFYTWLEEGENLPGGRWFRYLPEAGVQVECNFSDRMPELNFDNEKVRQAVLDIAKYYLELGVDGFRFDAAKYTYFGENDRNIAFWEWYVQELKEINPEIYTVAEVWDGEGITNQYARAVNCFHFSTSQAEGLYAETARGGDVNKLTQATARYLEELRQVNPEAMDIPFLSNHDMDRAAGYLPMSNGRMAMAANLYILTPGSPFLYYGEEIGLRGSRGGADTDANRRLKILWGDGDPIRDPEGSDYKKQTTYSVRDLEKIPGSLLNHYRKVIAVRKANPEIARGEYLALSFADTKLGGFLCTWNGKTVGVFHNTTEKELTVDLKEATEQPFTEVAAVLEAIPGEGGAALDGTVLTLGPQTSAVLR